MSIEKAKELRDCLDVNAWNLTKECWKAWAREALAELEQQAERIKELEEFLKKWDGHDFSCGVNREGFEGCDLTMFNCNCGYEKAKDKVLKKND